MKDKDQEWYSNSLGVLDPLRWHLNEVIESVESFNRFAVRLGQESVPIHQTEEAKKALEKANEFFRSNSADPVSRSICQDC